MHRSLPILLVVLASFVLTPVASADEGQHAQAQSLVAEGLKDARAKRFEAAAKNFDAAFKLFPHADISHNLGRALEELGRSVEAIDAFKRALDMDASYKYAADARERITTLDLKLRETHGVVTIRSTPDAVSVAIDVDGKPFASHLSSPVTRYIPAGAFVVRAEKVGFVNVEEHAEVAAGVESIIDLVLRPVPKKGFLTVTADAEGAQVFVDGALVGTAPVEGHALSAGRHALKVSAPGRLPFEASVDVRPNAEERVGATLALAELDEGDASLGLWGGVLLGSGGGVAVVATTLWIFAANKAEEARTASDDETWKAAANSAQSLEAGAWVSASAALGLIGTGAALLILSAQDDDGASAQWAPLVAPVDEGMSFGALVRF